MDDLLSSVSSLVGVTFLSDDAESIPEMRNSECEGDSAITVSTNETRTNDLSTSPNKRAKLYLAKKKERRNNK